MEVPAAEARLGMESVRLVAWWSMVPTVLGVGPVDRWRSLPPGVPLVLQRVTLGVRDYP
jgi:hypothetical protein